MASVYEFEMLVDSQTVVVNQKQVYKYKYKQNPKLVQVSGVSVRASYLLYIHTLGNGGW